MLEPALSVYDNRILFAVAEQAVLRPLGTFPNGLALYLLTVRPEVVLLVRLITPHSNRLQLVNYEL